MPAKEIVESFDSCLTESSFDTDSGLLQKVCVFGSARSKNKRIYSEKAIGDLHGLTNGAKSFLNHPTASENKDRRASVI